MAYVVYFIAVSNYNIEPEEEKNATADHGRIELMSGESSDYRSSTLYKLIPLIVNPSGGFLCLIVACK